MRLAGPTILGQEGKEEHKLTNYHVPEEDLGSYLSIFGESYPSHFIH